LKTDDSDARYRLTLAGVSLAPVGFDPPGTLRSAGLFCSFALAALMSPREISSICMPPRCTRQKSR